MGGCENRFPSTLGHELLVGMLDISAASLQRYENGPYVTPLECILDRLCPDYAAGAINRWDRAIPSAVESPVRR